MDGSRRNSSTIITPSPSVGPDAGASRKEATIRINPRTAVRTSGTMIKAVFARPLGSTPSLKAVKATAMEPNRRPTR